MARRVFLHVGTPKSGTTYLQDKLAANRAGLAERRPDLPRHQDRQPLRGRARPDRAALGGARTRRAGSVGPRSPAAAMRARGDAVVSHEILAVGLPRAGRPGAWPPSPTPRCTSSSPRATWAGRSRPSGRRPSSTAAGCSSASSSASSRRPRAPARTEWFWRVQGLPDVLGRWSAGLSPSARPPAHRPSAGRRAGCEVLAVGRIDHVVLARGDDQHRHRQLVVALGHRRQARRSGTTTAAATACPSTPTRRRRGRRCRRRSRASPRCPRRSSPSPSRARRPAAAGWRG